MSKKMNFSSLLVIVLLIVVICSVVSVLSCIEAKSDYTMAIKQGQTVKQLCQLNNDGQYWLDSCSYFSDGNYLKVLSDDFGHQLSIKVSVNEGNVRVTCWKYLTLWQEDTSLNVWGSENAN